jgi:hypothetical protein
LAFVRLRPWTAQNRQNCNKKSRRTGSPKLLLGGANLIGRIDMLRSKLAPIAVMMLLSVGFVLFPQGSANAAKFCAQLRGSTAAGEPNCSFSTLDACRARVRHLGGGHCYKLTTH